MKDKESRLFRFFIRIGRLKWNTALKAVFGGAAAGILAVLYRIVTERGVRFSAAVYSFLKIHPQGLILWAIAAAGAGFFISWLIRLEPMASGGGVPQVEGVILYGLKMRWYLVIAIRYAAGFLGSLFGLSFGPEGPSIQLGAAANQAISKKIAKSRLEENCLITGGAAAGLSAAFSAPLTGCIFALEEIHRSFSPLVLLSATAASLSADFISKYFFGLKPVLYFPNVPQLPLLLYLWLLPLAVFVGVTGVSVNRGLLLSQKIYTRVRAPFRPVIALLFALPCGVFLPQVLGGGRQLIPLTPTTNQALSVLVLLLAVKILFSCTSFGSGTPGGIFMPIISIGALSGNIFGLAAVFFGLPAKYVPVFIICGIAGGLTASVKAPVTSLLLTAELTGSFLHILPVAICSFLSLFLSDMLKTDPIYEALLRRFMGTHRESLPEKTGEEHSFEKRSYAAEFPVESGSSVAGRMLREVSWPEGCLVASLRRGSRELIPNGGTLILPGDYLLVLVPEHSENRIRRKIRRMCRI